MKITVLVENTSSENMKVAHGLSLYIETAKHNMLFDLGPDHTLFENAKTKGIDLQNVDVVVISHGHRDHGGALEEFLQSNDQAKVYIQESAFEAHYSKSGDQLVEIGLDKKLKDHERVVLLQGDYRIDEELQLFTVNSREKCYSEANDVLYNQDGLDDFLHEQNLLIFEGKTALIMGCGHTGVINIMEQIREMKPAICVGGFHLYRPRLKQCVSETLLNQIAIELKKYNQTQFYTCHCTGEKAFSYLAERMNHVHYISCGEEIHL